MRQGYRVRSTSEFQDWMQRLRDIRAKARIAARIDRFALGNFGDVKTIGGNIRELRIDYGPGYRVYFAQIGETVVILLCGGDKSSQDRDIVRARQIAERTEALS